MNNADLAARVVARELLVGAHEVRCDLFVTPEVLGEVWRFRHRPFRDRDVEGARVPIAVRSIAG